MDLRIRMMLLTGVSGNFSLRRIKQGSGNGMNRLTRPVPLEDGRLSC
jgi:hypothetical protein